MPEMTNRQKLREAARLVAEVDSTLNLHSAVCTCCNGLQFSNWNHKRLHDTLAPMTDKLRRLADLVPSPHVATRMVVPV